MAWKKSKPKTEKLTAAEYNKEAERIEKELEELKKKNPREEEEESAEEPQEEKQTATEKPQIARAEVFDIIEGNLSRANAFLQYLK